MLAGALVRSWLPFLQLLVETASLVDILPVEHSKSISGYRAVLKVVDEIRSCRGPTCADADPCCSNPQRPVGVTALE